VRSARRRILTAVPVLGYFSPLGWAATLLAAICLAGALSLQWLELAYAAAFFAVLVGMSCLLTIGRTLLDVRLRVHPSRVSSGDVAVAEVRVGNLGKSPLFPIPLELPFGDQSIRFLVPALRPKEDHDELLVLPTERRGIYDIGPVTTLRGDPLGLVRRSVTWGDQTTFIVYPRVVTLRPFGTGMLRDLDGQATSDVSRSDLAFHAIREYQPGDDHRHIHWATTAKRSSGSGAPELMVRQFLDTRRTHIGVVLDNDSTSYANEAEFELAVQVAASISHRAIADKVDLSQSCGAMVLPAAGAQQAMDMYARADFGVTSPLAAATAMATKAPSVSLAVFVSGSRIASETLTRSLSAFPAGAGSITIRVLPGAQVQRQRSPGRLSLWLGALGELPAALASNGAS